MTTARTRVWCCPFSDEDGTLTYMNTRTLAIAALVIAVIVLLMLVL